MSSAATVRPFNPSEERNIPAWPGPGPVPTGPERVYVLSMRMADGRLEFYFLERPSEPDPIDDGPLEIRIPTNCVVVLRLDKAWEWEFRHEDAVVLGPMKYKDDPRYFNLVPEIHDGLCHEVRFNALYLNVSDHLNRDPYAIYINLYQKGPRTSSAVALLVRIDPDVANPGDHH